MRIFPVLICYSLTFLPVTLHAAQLHLGESPCMPGTDCTASFSDTWHVLGPFQVGTREAAWGADPLERYGGFSNLEYNQDATFPSSLTANATVRWSQARARHAQSCDAFSASHIELTFPEVDWEFQRSVYGWAALQFQAWARCDVFVNGDVPQTFIMFTDQVIEFRVNGLLFWGGDFYSYRKSPPVLHLSPGIHRLDFRLIRDVRAHGGVLPAAIEACIELRPQNEAVALGEHSVFPDVVGSTLSSDVASISVRNNGHSVVNVLGVALVKPDGFATILHSPAPIFPGQTRPVAFRLQLEDASSSDMEFTLRYHDESIGGHDVDVSFKHLLTRRNISEPHKYTYLHPGGIVSYAILRPPPQVMHERSPDTRRVPILINLHGAGVEAESAALRHSLDATSNLAAWTVFPTGVNSWSSDDWHTWGLADVEAAIAAIPSWIDFVQWCGNGVETSKWLVTGHSNGGQGTWYLATHRPDKVLAAVPASAYSSIQQYVPYSFWRETDPLRTAVVHAALGSYRHELLISNCEDIPMLVQHGGDDDNVPVFHSRRMMDLASQLGNTIEFHEVAGKPHYWDGVMTTDPLLSFYRRYLEEDQDQISRRTNFTLTVANPRNMGSKEGVSVLQLVQPGQLGRLRVLRTPNETRLETSNIRSFSMNLEASSRGDLIVDGMRFSHIEISKDLEKHVCFGLDKQKIWKIHSPVEANPTHVSPGGMEAIMQSEGRFTIISDEREKDYLALQVARNLYQYFSADTEIVREDHQQNSTAGNIIRIGLGSDTATSSSMNNSPLHLGPTAVRIRDDLGQLREYQASEKGLNTIHLRQLAGGRLELMIWGADQRSLETISRLVPMMTGVGQPDFVIADNDIAWKGLDGVLALGFFDADWNVSRTSYLT